MSSPLFDSLPVPVPENARRLNALFERIPPDRLAGLTEAVVADAAAAGAWGERNGAAVPLPVVLRPRLVTLGARGYVHHVAWQVRMGLRRLVQLSAHEPRVRALLPMDPAERAWIERYARPADEQPGERLFCRLDALVRFDGPGWRATLEFVEPNVVGIGGMSSAPAVGAAIARHVVPLLVEQDPELTLEADADPRELLAAELLAHARETGCLADRPRVALVDDRDLYTLGGEMGKLEPWLCEHGLEARSADPRDLRAEGGGVTLDGERIDVVYRFLDLRDLVAMEEAGGDLSGLRAAFEAGIVVPSVGGDLEHKSAFEVLTSPDFADLFTPAQRIVFDTHVLWTRLLRERRTIGPGGDPVELLEFARRNRERLVLKPNRESGGEGVLIGLATTPSDWEATLHDAASTPDTWVVQRVSLPDRAPYPIVSPEGRLSFEPLFASAGFYPGRRGLAVFGRYAPDPVVNLSRGGGLLAYMTDVA